MKCGVVVLASVSVLNPVSAIQSTGKKKTRTISQVRTPSNSRVTGLVCRSARVSVRAAHRPASPSSLSRPEIIRRANVATMIVAMTTTTDMAEARPMS